MGTGRKENLINPADRTSEELRAMTVKGGKKSGEVRRQRKTFREGLEWLLTHAELPDALKEQLKKQGCKPDEMNHMMVILRSLIAKAEQGDVQAFNAIIAQVGEKPADKLDVKGNLDNEVVVRYIGKEGDEIFPSSEAEVLEQENGNNP